MAKLSGLRTSATGCTENFNLSFFIYKMRFVDDLWTVLTHISLIISVSIWFSTGQQIILVSFFTFFLLLPAIQPFTAYWYFHQRQFRKLKADKNCSHHCKAMRSSWLIYRWKLSIELPVRPLQTFWQCRFSSVSRSCPVQIRKERELRKGWVSMNSSGRRVQRKPKVKGKPFFWFKKDLKDKGYKLSVMQDG